MKLKKVFFTLVLITICFAITVDISNKFSCNQSITPLTDIKLSQTVNNESYSIDWVKMWRDSYHNYGRKITIDKNDSIYLVGTSYDNSLFGYDISLNKLNKTGDVLWKVTIDGPIADYGVDIALDSQDDPYIVGTMDFHNLLFNSTISTIKFDPYGNESWTQKSKRYDTGRSRAKGIATDSRNNIYTVGNIGGNITLLKYNSTGHSMWNNTIEGWLTDEGNDVAVDSNDNPYVVGITRSFIDNATVIKLNSEGIQLVNFSWLQDEYLKADRIVIDPNDRIYVSGTYTPVQKSFLVRYDTTGSFLWNYSFPFVPKFYVRELTLDSNGNILAVGHDDNLMYVYKIDPDGVLLWNDTYTHLPGEFAFYYGIAVDSNDNIFISGTTQDESSRDNYILIKYVPPTTPTTPNVPTDSIIGYDIVLLIIGLISITIFFTLRLSRKKF